MDKIEQIFMAEVAIVAAEVEAKGVAAEAVKLPITKKPKVLLLEK